MKKFKDIIVQQTKAESYCKKIILDSGYVYTLDPTTHIVYKFDNLDTYEKFKSIVAVSAFMKVGKAIIDQCNMYIDNNYTTGDLYERLANKLKERIKIPPVTAGDIVEKNSYETLKNALSKSFMLPI